MAAIEDNGAVRHPAEQSGKGSVKFTRRLNEDGAVTQAVEFFFRQLDIEAQPVAEGHLGKAFRHAAEAQGPGRDHAPCGNLRMDVTPQLLQRLSIGHPVGKRRVPQQIDAVAGLFEFRRDDLRGLHRRDAEGNQRRGHVDLLEGAAHRVFAADGRQAQGYLHPQGAQQGGERLAPGMRIGCHPFEVFLIGEAHRRPVTAGGSHLGASLDNRVGRCVIRAPGRQVGIVAEGHHARRVGLSRHGQLLHGDLRLRVLPAAAIRHQDRTAADGRVEHLDQALLRLYIGL